MMQMCLWHFLIQFTAYFSLVSCLISQDSQQLGCAEVFGRELYTLGRFKNDLICRVNLDNGYFSANRLEFPTQEIR